MMPSLPVISVASLVSDNPDVRADAVSQLGHECGEVVFFYVSDHGIPDEFGSASVEKQ